MADNNVKVINLTKVVNGKTHKITVTDTDKDFSGSVMGFDKNDKVAVVGDISVFTQDEIKKAFFNGYKQEDTRSDADLKNLSTANLNKKGDGVTGDTSKEFRLGDLAKALDVNKVNQTSVSSTETKVTTTSTPINVSVPYMTSELPYPAAGLVKQVTNFLGFSIASNYGQIPFLNGNLNQNSITAMAKYVWDNVPGCNMSNPFVTNSNVTTTSSTITTLQAEAKSLGIVFDANDTVETLQAKIRDFKAAKSNSAVITEGTTGSNSTGSSTTTSDGSVVITNADGSKSTKYIVQPDQKIEELVRMSLKAQGKENPTEAELKEATQKFVAANKDNIGSKNGNKFVYVGRTVLLDGDVTKGSLNAEEAEKEWAKRHSTTSSSSRKAANSSASTKTVKTAKTVTTPKITKTEKHTTETAAARNVSVEAKLKGLNSQLVAAQKEFEKASGYDRVGIDKKINEIQNKIKDLNSIKNSSELKKLDAELVKAKAEYKNAKSGEERTAATYKMAEIETKIKKLEAKLETKSETEKSYKTTYSMHMGL